MNNSAQPNDVDFTVDKDNLYKEESITDLKVASIRRLVPIKEDGTEDLGRAPIFMGHTQLMSQQGPIPIQAGLTATTLEGAIKEFPGAMKQALDEVIDKIKKLQQQQVQQQRDRSRIIVPGR
jgi:hypothetical protein